MGNGIVPATYSFEVQVPSHEVVLLLELVLDLLESGRLQRRQRGLHLREVFHILVRRADNLLQAKTGFLLVSFFFLKVRHISWLLLPLLLSFNVSLYIFEFILEGLKHLRVTIVEELVVGVLHGGRHSNIITRTNT